MQNVDLNADIGEGMPYDDKLLEYISSCNIASSGHYGNETSIFKTIELAQKNKVNIGAHPSYPDQVNFGRMTMTLSQKDLIDSIHEQLNLFKKCVKSLKANWTHIKFHGALYNDLKSDALKANAIVAYLKQNYPNKILFVPPQSAIEYQASKELQIKLEGFADRAYNADLSLVSRHVPNAVLKEESQIIDQVLSMVLHQKVKTIKSHYQPISIDTICLHGDTPQALRLAKSIVKILNDHNISIQ